MWTARILCEFFKSILSNRQLRYDTERLGPNICAQHSYLSTCLYPQNNKHMIPKANKDNCRALSDYVGTVIIFRVGHESDLPMIQTALASTSLADAIIVSSVKEALTTTSQVCLLVQDKLDETPLVRQILTDALRGSTLTILGIHCKILKFCLVISYLEWVERARLPLATSSNCHSICGVHLPVHRYATMRKWTHGPT